MSTIKDFTMRQYNGIDYDTLYPKTTSQQVLLNDSELAQFWNIIQTNPNIEDTLKNMTETIMNCGYWMRRTLSFTETSGSIGTSAYFKMIGDSSTNITIYYSEETIINDNGWVVFNNPQSITANYSTASSLSILSGKYWIVGGNYPLQQAIPYFTPADGRVTITLDSSIAYLYDSNYSSSSKKTVLANFVPSYGTWEFLEYTTDDTKYTPNYQNGYYYTYETKPLWSGKIAQGSYVGTGVAGLDNQNQLSFNFTPNVLIIRIRASFSSNRNAIYFWGNNVLYCEGGDSSQYANNVCIGDKTIQWCYTGSTSVSSYQLNAANYVYDYIAIG